MNPVPQSSAESVFANRRKLMEWVHLASAITLALFAIIHFMMGCCYALSYVEAALALVMMVSWQLVRRGASLSAIENMLMSSAVVLFSALVLLDSLYATGIYWAAGYPFVAYFVQPASRARYWVGLFVAELVVLTGIDAAKWLSIPYSAGQLACLISAVIFYWILAHIYKAQLELRQFQLEESYLTLAEQQERLQVILDYSPIGIWMLDDDRHIRFLNRTWANWCETAESDAYSDGDYNKLLSAIFPGCKAWLLDQDGLESGNLCYSREELPCADHVIRTLDVIRVRLPGAGGRASGLVGFAIDVTAQLKAQAEQQDLLLQIQHGQRLESLGVMAGGIAHDFNNLLTAIQGSIELVKLEEGLSPDVMESLDTMDTATRTAADLCRQMLAYSGKGLMKPEQFNLQDLIEELHGLIDVSVGKEVSLEVEFDPAAKPVSADRSQISQVLLNLSLNAAESMPAGRHGHIRITVSHRHLSEHADVHFVGKAALQPGDYTVLAVEDDGAGMDEEVAERIFDPFFTTKFTGRGLGLSAIIGILNAHDAGMVVDSRKGAGTAMHVWLPCYSGADILPGDSTAQATEVYAGRVLLVDDEPGVIQVGTRMLEKLGLQVVAACSGQEALNTFSRDPLSFDWVLLDVTMPGMDGAECLQQLRRIRPEIHVVMTSGYDADSVQEQGCEPDDFLPKPYTIEKLRQIAKRAVS
ncbi:PAS domain-containing sensor histidine kinase [Mariprofundus ferrooxydans]|uniref:hybrid sensor histidine kinase/response regulator n=1 Tax=Mariprofundus ferrooxydans TaxID=314344 RepID=UPI000475695C|nr:PAS domain-containing sensor histidine kinase [Mariprofundus ferrooxydans]